MPRIKIQSCVECRESLSSRHYTADSFEVAFDWHCKAMTNKVIEEYVCWNEPDPKVPSWCPKRCK